MNTKPDNNDKETFLSDWIAGKISDNQLKTRVSEADFEAYQKLRFSLQALDVSAADMDKNYAFIQHKIADKKNLKQPKIVGYYTYFAAAAMLVLFFGLYQTFVFSNTFETAYGKTANLALNDFSEVTLNAKSKITYPTFFKVNRSLKLEGEAFFKVAKGSTFTVESGMGNIEVLGTQFNVIALPDYLEVHCYEGKVKVTSASASFVLTPGKSVRIYNHQTETWEENTKTKPTWMYGESSFKNTPLQAVIAQFEKQYAYQVQFPKVFAATRFTGSFSHANLHTALQSICLPLQLHYSQTNAQKIIISK